MTIKPGLSEVETAKRHLRDCMESPDYPVHNCYVTCNDVAYLLAEVEQLRRERNILVLDRDAFEKDVERATLGHELTKAQKTGVEIERDELRAEVQALRAALTLGQVMLDSLNDENEFNPDTVHAFAVALGELAY